MAQADGHDGSARTEHFDCDLVAHGFEGEQAPPNVYVEVSADYNDSLVAIIAAGEAGRYSIDFSVDSLGRVDVEKAYIEGMRSDVDELPDWIDAVVDKIERVLTGE